MANTPCHFASQNATPTNEGNNMRKYWLVFRNAAEGQLRNPAVLVMRLAFLAFLVFVTQKLWQAIGHHGFDPVDIVWYLVMNETLFFSYDSKIIKQITNDVRFGNVGYHLMRPISYFAQQLTESMGIFCAKLPFLMIGGSVLAYLLTGGLPTTPCGMVVIFPLMIMSGLFTSVCLVAIGMLALYMHNPNSIYIVWQKFMFVFGGLFFPLTIYPEWMQRIATLTPFPWGVYEVSRLIYEFSWPIAFNAALHLIIWTAVAFLIANRMSKVLLRKVSVNGG